MKRAFPLLLLAAGCVSYEATIREFDSVAGYDPARQVEPTELEYNEFAERLPSLLRPLQWFGAADLVAAFLAIDMQRVRVDEPVGFARSRLDDMVAAAGNRLDHMAEVGWRLLLVIERDPTPLNRAVAVRQLGELLAVFKTDPITPDSPGLATAPVGGGQFQVRAQGLVKTLEASWPGVAERPDAARDAYATALRDLVELDAGTLTHERSRIRLLLEAMRSERDRAVAELGAGYLLEALETAANHGLAAAIGDPESIVRAAGARALWRRGGGAMLPWILAALQKRTRRVLPAAFAGAAPFDVSTTVRRRVLHYCWAIDTALAGKRYRGGPSAYSALVDAALRDRESSLQALAREALAFHLRRPVDPAGAWIKDWWTRYVAEGESGG